MYAYLIFLASCDFEQSSNPCQWSNIHNEDFDWIIHTGSTASSGTGPDSDHTLGTSTGIPQSTEIYCTQMPVYLLCLLEEFRKEDVLQVFTLLVMFIDNYYRSLRVHRVQFPAGTRRHSPTGEPQPDPDELPVFTLLVSHVRQNHRDTQCHHLYCCWKLYRVEPEWRPE